MDTDNWEAYLRTYVLLPQATLGWALALNVKNYITSVTIFTNTGNVITRLITN